MSGASYSIVASIWNILLLSFSTEIVRKKKKFLGILKKIFVYILILKIVEHCSAPSFLQPLSRCLFKIVSYKLLQPWRIEDAPLIVFLISFFLLQYFVHIETNFSFQWLSSLKLLFIYFLIVLIIYKREFFFFF